jgi:SOS-response transcriptional repressor LexA
MNAQSGICCPGCGHTLYQRRRADDGAAIQGVTRSEGKVLEVYVRAALERRLTPSMEEAAAVVGFRSKGAVHRCVVSLVAKGLLERGDQAHARARDLSITARAWRLYGINAPEPPHA